MAEETEVQETTQDSTPDGSEAEVQPEEVSGESSQTGFQLESLKRLKSNNEVERYVATLEGAVKEQGARLTAAETAPPPPPPTEPVGERKGFWDGPEEYLERDRNVLLEEMRKMVSPFHSDLSASKETRARTQMRSEFGEEWDRYEPVVNGLLAEGQAQGLGVDPSNPQMLRTLFYTAKGYMAAEGPTPTEAPKPSIPQHRPSGAPLPDETGGKPQLRELTENERRLAKESHMTHEEYLNWQEMDEGDVIKTELTDA